jgi:hypothetical protein
LLLAIWHWEIPPRLDYLELTLSSLFGNPGRWFFRREAMVKMQIRFGEKKGGVRNFYVRVLIRLD